MERQRPVPFELFRHFKGNMYQIISVAIHSETREEMVVYQALYGDYKVYVRPLNMFMSEVDHVKYPSVKQKYRFERIERDSDGRLTQESGSGKKEESDSIVKSENVIRPEGEVERKEKSDIAEKEEIRKQFRSEPYHHSEIMDKSIDAEAKELNLNPLVIEFMDADLAVDKKDILSKLRPVITNDMIDIMAMSLGVVVNEGDVYDRYNDLRTCLTTMEKFESTRLRS
ncbi:Protein of unknown function [Butyrivibrio proteoclasticus]|uniref:DUF1653 domain-containing protein n=1 Tax=Butyrivibrio proteoclasticus TaxID=43305 RepID=A0A1I5R2S8_9FIRM|nr:DUF1653 domain-containing protein [Butyrivibrio proteoclasticus]SFP52812.1 Protein of unknown function [Butyrivibrio proteoclasticus]